MSNIELLKQELITQKNTIEQKGGVVNVANLNPSPREITEGIKSIITTNVTDGTATEQDVLLGKTFYASGSTIRTGSFNKDSYTYDLFLFQPYVQTNSNKIPFTMKEGKTTVRAYAFIGNRNKVEFNFSSTLTDVGEGAFYDCPYFEFPNFSSLTNVTTLAMNCFYHCTNMNNCFESLPASLNSIDARAFADVPVDGYSINIPNNVTYIGSYAFANMTYHANMKNLYFPSNFAGVLNPYVFQFLTFESDFRVPNNCTEVGTGFNYRGSFANIVIPSNCLYLRDYCFGGVDTDYINSYNLKTVVFESATPPSFGYDVFATQHITNGFKIYVPDVAIEEYKAIGNLAKYINNIYPISQKV